MGPPVNRKGLVLVKYMITTTLTNTLWLVYAIYNWQPFVYFTIFYLTLTFERDLSEIGAIFIEQDGWIKTFQILFIFKYLKVVVHTLSFLLYRPIPIPTQPTIHPSDVTVIIPTVGAIDEPEFRETLQTILANNPYEIIVCTVGKEKYELADQVCSEEVTEAALLSRGTITTKVQIIAITEPSKRKQIFAAIQQVNTSIIALADDHVFWGPNYLKASLAPFEDPGIGAVGTNKRVRRDLFQFTWPNFLNFIACNYLERHNFECTASVNVDQGVFVLSGRTALYRTAILKHPSFPDEYLRETWWFGTVGKDGFTVDDDNLLTRYIVGIAKYKVWFQNSKDSTMHTTLGDPEKFFKQMDRWIRTTWRSNSTSLFSDQSIWKTQPWSVYAIYFSSFVNFALFYDLALTITLWIGIDDLEITLDRNINRVSALALLSTILFLSKMIKPFPHFWRNPCDLLWVPGYVLFGYYHTFIKLKALFTVNIVAWGTRPGVK